MIQAVFPEIAIWQKMAMQKKLFAPLLLAGSVLGSMYAGITTPTEAAGVGVLGSIVCAAINRKLNTRMLWHSTIETVRISTMLAWLMFSAQTIIGAYTPSRGADFVKKSITSLDLGPWGTIFLMKGIWIFLGCFLDWVGILFLTVPLFLPIALGLGFDNIWLGVVFCMNMRISYLSPPSRHRPFT